MFPKRFNLGQEDILCKWAAVSQRLGGLSEIKGEKGESRLA
jgi:hypothetical protein